MSLRVILTLIQKDWRSFARNIPLILNTASRSCKLSQTSSQLIHNLNTAYSVKLRGRRWGEASVSSSRLPYTYMEYSLKLIREVYGDIFGKSAGMVWGSLSKKRGEALCKTPENKIRKP